MLKLRILSPSLTKNIIYTTYTRL